MTDCRPWEVLPREPGGDDEAMGLFLAVGMALTCWEQLDTAQGWLFASIVSSKRGAAEAAYGSVASGPGRSSMVIAAADRLFAPRASDLVEEISNLVNDVGRLLGRRNDIAHGVVTEFHDNGKSLGCYLVPPDYNTRRRLNETKAIAVVRSFKSIKDYTTKHAIFGRLMYAYTAQQVEWYMGHFQDYRKKMLDLMVKTQTRRAALFPSPETPLTPSVPPADGGPEGKDSSQ